MKVSSSQPFQIIYSIFQHEYLGYLLESFVVHLDQNDKLTLQHQKVSAKNAIEFSSGLDDADFKLIEIMDSMQQESVVHHFSKRNEKPRDFFLKIYGNASNNELLLKEIEDYLERRRADALRLITGKKLFEMGNDGEPTWREIEVVEEKASVLFHFRKNEDNTHYFPTIKCGDEKVMFKNNGSYLICKTPAWLVAESKLYHFNQVIDGSKLAPFLKKKFILIPEAMEATYYEKFVAPLVANYHVYAKGFDIKTKHFDPVPILNYFSLAAGKSLSLFDEKGQAITAPEEDSRIVFQLVIRYGEFEVSPDNSDRISVELQIDDGHYTFYRISRRIDHEQKIKEKLIQWGLPLDGSKALMEQIPSISWLSENQERLAAEGFEIKQTKVNGKKFFVGETSIDIKIEENIDWFDIKAIIKFGDYEISFNDLRKLIVKGKYEFRLPNNEIAVIPESWLRNYEEIFSFADADEEDQPRLKKHHIGIVSDLESGDLAKVKIDRKLESLKDYEKIDDHELPKKFSGSLRPYQKAGYNWLVFLNKYKFGGCLADDMGLGKTVQTLALLQQQKEEGAKNASLLIMPTSLVYNWEMEASKFTPEMKLLVYTGGQRIKDSSLFNDYDLVVTSYGITRLDIDVLCDYYFNYVVLDESQAIKNPSSNIAQAVQKLKSKNRLILSGTPLENSTLDLWSQLSFINPGLLGGKNFFVKEYQKPIEKNSSQEKVVKLNRIVKPFILRRNKAQVLKDLPEKVDNVQYCSMTPAQENKYEEIKSYYRGKILNKIDEGGMKSSQMLILKGLTQLRQLANHPKMLDPEYQDDSGKMDDIVEMLTNSISKGHKILVFSQFVKHLQIFRDYLDKKKMKYAYLDGNTKNRKEEVDRFQSDKTYKLFLISLKAGGLGLNLTEADYVFLLDPWWNPAVEAQAIDRAHRIGQKKSVFTYKFITKNTVEEKILTLQQKKKKLVSDLIPTEESFVKSLDRTDIEALLN